MMRCIRWLIVALLATALCGSLYAADAHAADGADLFDSGRLLGTGGVTQVEGQGGGGVVPWALITGYGTRDAIGANGHYSYIYLPNYQLHSFGVASGLYDRVELSYSRTLLDTGATGKILGLGAGYTIRLDTLGVKLRLAGDAVYDQDRWMPQLTAGLQFKVNDRGSLLRAIGARGDEGVDAYLAASKLFLSESVLLNATLRATKANQTGLLGFGGDRLNAYRPQVELAAAYLVTRQLALGAEYRSKPDNLRFARESDWSDLFAAYFFNKHVSANVAFVDLGSIARRKNQEGIYASLQIGL
jgi:hypothetical protein